MHYAEYKTILSPQNNMNIYRGCTHGCIYCDSRSKCYEMNHQFEDIEIKRNAPIILQRQLQTRRNAAMISTGAMSDPYCHIEKELKLTRACLAIIERYGFGISILTKSNLILRDLDLLSSINRKTKCVVQMTLTTYDDNLCRKIEPNVSVSSERFKVLKEFHNEGIPVVVWLGPILPYINNSEENLQALMEYCIEAKVYGIICFGFGVTLREGNREYFYDKLDIHFPGVREKYMKSFGNSYVCNSENNQRLMSIFIEKCRKYNILYKTRDIFSYLMKFESKNQQLSMF